MSKHIEALKLALEALNDLSAWNDGEVGSHMDEPYAAEVARRTITAIKEALAQTQEPFAWADLQKEAQQIVESKFLWKQFIDGTPLANDIACWMADFARQYTAPPLPVQPEQEPVAWEQFHEHMAGSLYKPPPQRPWVGLTDEEREAIYELHHNQYAECESVNFGYEKAIEAKLREKNA